MKTALITVALVAATSWTWAQQPPTISLPADVDRVLKDYARAWEANDPVALSQLFDAAGMALPSGQPPAVGVESIRKAYSTGAGSPLHLRPIAFGASGELAYVIGEWGTSPSKPDFGKFTLVLRRGADGGWRIVSDMDNANTPPQPPAAGATPLPRHGLVMFSNFCVSAQSGDLYGLRLTLRRLGDVDDLLFELASDSPQRIWPVSIDAGAGTLRFTMPAPYSGAEVTARVTQQGGLVLEGPVLNADGRDRFELQRVIDFRRRLPNC